MSTTTTTPTELRARLVALCAERGVVGAENLIGRFDDEELPGKARAVDYFDDQPEPKGPGLLVSLLQSGEADGYERRRSQPPVPRGVASITVQARAWAAEHFPEQLVIAAAGEACNLKVMGKRVSKQIVEARLRETQPELFA